MPQPAPLQTVTVGEIGVTFLPDGGGVVAPTALYPASDEAGWEKHQELLDAEGKFITTVGAFYLEVGEHRVAVDLGIGPGTIDFPGFGPFSGGRYPESAKEAGIVPEEVTAVFFTHLHLDHCGWTTVEDEAGIRRLFYPNARYLCHQAEWEFWYGGDNPVGPHPEYVQQPLADRIAFVGDVEEIAPGVTAVFTPGHTPGHMSLRLESNGERAYLTADLLHGPMQLEEMDWSVAFDIDAAQARATREALYPELAQPDVLVGVNHFADHVFGYIQPEGDHYGWQPLAG